MPTTEPNEQPKLVFYICHGGGFTAVLHQYALDRPGSSVHVLVDGPYGGINVQKYYEGDHVLVIAGGSGAGWCLPFVEQFARHHLVQLDEEQGQVVSPDSKEALPSERLHEKSRSGPLFLRVILATRGESDRTWFLRTISELLSKCSATVSSSDIDVQVYLTGQASRKDNPTSKAVEESASKEFASSADDKITPEKGNTLTVPEREFKGRPQLPRIIQEEVARVMEAGQSLSIFVCGPTTMQNDVRNAAAEENLKILRSSKAGSVYLYSEHFSWA